MARATWDSSRGVRFAQPSSWTSGNLMRMVRSSRFAQAMMLSWRFVVAFVHVVRLHSASWLRRAWRNAEVGLSTVVDPLCVSALIVGTRDYRGVASALLERGSSQRESRDQHEVPIRTPHLQARASSAKAHAPLAVFRIGRSFRRGSSEPRLSRHRVSGWLLGVGAVVGTTAFAWCYGLGYEYGSLS